jgi:tetratricopeptide (TPR) repeat protein
MRFIACLVLAAGLVCAAEPLAQVFDKAAAALSSGDYAAAEAGFQQVLKASPNHIGALGNLGVVYSKTGRLDKAIGVYRRALRLSPSDKGLLLNLGLAYVKQDSYADALPIFQSLVKAAPGNLQARELLATTELHTGQLTAAVRGLETLSVEDRQNTGLLYLLGIGYLKQNQPEKAHQALEAFLTSAPPAQANFMLCKAYYEAELFDEAAGQCRKSLEIDPSLIGAHRELGKVLVSQRSLDASTELAAAVRQDPNDSEALYFLGAALLQEDRVEEAVTHLERARQLSPGFWGNYFYLGKAKLQLKQTAQAVPLFEKAAALNSSESAVYYQLGRALQALGKTEEANRAMQRVRELKAIGLDKETKAIQK